ncbi:MAG TPA: cytochrome-c peroxidase [Planctomycetota bacterium]|nr:cytochrome-c peroxidase [Planctomycetota bacterium]
MACFLHTSCVNLEATLVLFRWILGLVAVALLVGAGLAVALVKSAPSPAPPAAVAPLEEENPAWMTEPIHPLPLRSTGDPRKIALGRKLFLDKRLSQDRSISCASCHDLTRGGADGRPVSIGVGGQAGDRNAPTVFNVAFNFRQFWDGRADTLEQQVEGPLLNPKEMKNTWPEILKVLQDDADYRNDFQAIFTQPLQKEQVTACLASFLRSLVTVSRFDRFLRGDGTAITDREKEGYELFKRKGCVTCHQGSNAGGNLFSKFGAMGDYFADRGTLDHADLGRFKITGREEDKYVFKVPSLRNVGRTAPYFHDGSVATLEEAVTIMAQYQLGKRLSSEEARLITEFLGSLSGETR